MSFPSSPTNGQIAVINNITYAYSSATNSWTRQQHTFNNTGPTPPVTNLLVGDIWYNTTDDTIYRYTYDGTSYYWIDIITPTVTSNSAINILSGVNTVNVVTLIANTINANTITVSSETDTLLIANTITSNNISSNNISANIFTISTFSSNALTTNTVNTNTLNANTITVSGNLITNSFSTSYNIVNYVANTVTANNIYGTGNLIIQSGTSIITLGNTGNISIVGNVTTLNVTNETITGISNIATLNVTTGSVAGYSIGYLTVPQNVQTANYNLTLADSGKHIFMANGTANLTITIPANGSVPFPLGSAITFVNYSQNNFMSIGITGDVMNYSNTAGTQGTRTLSQYGVATALKVLSNTWIISGTNLS